MKNLLFTLTLIFVYSQVLKSQSISDTCYNIQSCLVNPLEVKNLVLDNDTNNIQFITNFKNLSYLQLKNFSSNLNILKI